MICDSCRAVNPNAVAICQNCGVRLTSSVVANPGASLPELQSSAETIVQQMDAAKTTAPLAELQPREDTDDVITQGRQPLEGTSSVITQDQLPLEEIHNAISPDGQPVSDKQTPAFILIPPVSGLADRQILPAHLSPQVSREPVPSTAQTLPLTAVTAPVKKMFVLRMLEAGFKGLVRPVAPRTAAIVAAIVLICIVVAQVTDGEWAYGAMRAAFVALTAGILVLLVIGVRFLVGIRRFKLFLAPLLTLLVLLLVSATGFTQQSTIHRLQGQNLEGQKQWANAIAEFRLAGEGPPTSDNIARTDVEWGEQLIVQHQYTNAIVKLNTVLTTYGSASGEIGRAQNDEVMAYLALAKQEMQTQNYRLATNYLDDLLNQSYCNATCQAQADTLDATSYYKLAEGQLGAQQYDSATTNFQTILQRFADSPEAKQLHPELGQSILGQGKEQLARNCTVALPTYQQLTRDFSDTAAGKEAASALSAPQPVTGRFTSSIPNDPALAPMVFLAKNVKGNMPSDQFFQALQNAPSASIQRDGSFTIKSVAQGTYDLVWGTTRNNGDVNYGFKYHINDNTPVYVATVGQLCSFDFGPINETILVAS